MKTIKSMVLAILCICGTHHHHHKHGHHISHAYYVTFEKEGGEQIELKVKRYEYNEMAIGDKGTLTHQGTRYQGFEKT